MDRVHRDECNDPHMHGVDHHDAYNDLHDHDENRQIDELEVFLGRDILDDVLLLQHADEYVIDVPYP